MILCIVVLTTGWFIEKTNIAKTTNENHTSPYIASYVSGPWTDSTSGGYTAGNIILVNPTSNLFSNLTLAMQVDNSDVINPDMSLWDSNYTLNPPNSFFQSVLLFEDLQNFSTPITSINIGPNQKQTINLNIPSQGSFQFSSHNLKIYVSQNSFGDVINGQSLTVPQTEAYLQIVNLSAIESDQDTYHQYYNSTLNSDMVTIAYNPNFYQRYWNTSKHDYYPDIFGLAHYMGALDYTYFNVTVFNNNTFPVNSVTLSSSWYALNDYIVQPNETYLFPVKLTEYPSSAYATGYIANSFAPASSVPGFSWLLIVPLFAFTLNSALTVKYRSNNKKRHQDA